MEHPTNDNILSGVSMSVLRKVFTPLLESKPDVEVNNFEEIRKVVDVQWLSDFLRIEQIEETASYYISSKLIPSYVVPLWKKNANKFHRVISGFLEDEAMSDQETKDYCLSKIEEDFYRFKNTEEFERFLELLNEEEDEDSTSFDSTQFQDRLNAMLESINTTQNSIPDPLANSTPLAKRFKTNSEKIIPKKAEKKPQSIVPHFKLQLQLAWFLKSKKEKSDINYLKHFIFNTNFEHEDFSSQRKCDFFQSVVSFMDNTLLKAATNHIFKKLQIDNDSRKTTMNNDLSKLFEILKPSDDELRKIKSLEIGDSDIQNSIKQIARRREMTRLSTATFSQDCYKVYCREYRTGRKTYTACKNDHSVWTDYLDETLGIHTWKIQVTKMGDYDFLCIGVQIRENDVSENAKFYCWKSKNMSAYYDDGGEHLLSKRHIIEYQILGDDCRKKGSGYPQYSQYEFGNGFGERDIVSVTWGCHIG